MQGNFAPDSTAPPGGLSAWGAPDPSAPVIAHIEARVELQVIDRQGEWAHIVCNNGWQSWVDARLLVPIAAAAYPSAPAPVAAAPVAAAHPLTPRNPAITTIGSYTITLLDLLPAVGVVLGALLPWLRGAAGRSTGFNVPLAFLGDTAAHASGLSIGVLLAIAAAVSALAPRRPVRAAGYIVAFCVFAVYVAQLHRLINHSGVGVTAVLGAGVYVGILAAAAGLALTLLSTPGARR